MRSQYHSVVISRQAFYFAGVKYSSAKILCRHTEPQAGFQNGSHNNVSDFLFMELVLSHHASNM